MNTWEILKKELTKSSRPDTMGRNIDVNSCATLFVKIMHNLTDREESVKSMNSDEEVKNALLARRGIQELQKAGVLQ